jgi:hypothetical protein
MIASVPLVKRADGYWVGLNLTYYGFFSATANTVGVALMVLLMASVHVPVSFVVSFIAVIIAVAVPASRLVAAIVERKRNTFTIAGAAFVATLLFPPLALGVRHVLHTRLNLEVHLLPVLAGSAITYAIGESIGRLACISFGCCYGKPLSESHRLLQRLFARWNFIFSGPTKKITYAHGLDGQKVIPIQAVTAVFYAGTGLAGIFFFLKGWHGAAFLLTVGVTQVWRVLSEFFRADYRGGGKVSAYQVMAFLCVAYGFFWAAVLPSPPVPPTDLWSGLKSLFSLEVILFLQVLWVVAFLLTGRSMVTASTISFHVVKDRV